MIEKLSFYRETNTLPCRNLAVEKYLTLHAEEGECILYLWQNRRTVVIGRNQNAWKECNVHELEADGGFLVRRLSGGGAVYHDLGNLNFTFCVRKGDYDVSRQVSVILNAVKKLGIAAQKSGRNDLLAEGKKFSGNAYYQSGDFCYHHGTVMLDVDGEMLARYLHVSGQKLRGKGVDSVRSRVGNLKVLRPDITADLLAGAIREAFSEEYRLPAGICRTEGLHAMEEVRKDAERFASWEWTFGRKLAFNRRICERYPWGGVELLFEVENGIIKDCICYSDAMEQDLIGSIPEAMKGRRYDGHELETVCAMRDAWRNGDTHERI